MRISPLSHFIDVYRMLYLDRKLANSSQQLSIDKINIKTMDSKNKSKERNLRIYFRQQLQHMRNESWKAWAVDIDI